MKTPPVEQVKNMSPAAYFALFAELLKRYQLALLDLAEAHVDTLLPGIVGFCAPVFDSDGHMVLGMITLGPAANLDARWDGSVHRPLAAAAARLSSDLGYGGSKAA